MLLVAAAGCRESGDSGPVRVVDLIRQLEQAEKRPSTGVRVTVHEQQGVTHPSIVTAVPSRITWTLPVPRRGVLRALVAVPAGAGAGSVRFRFGVSDDRIYEALADVVAAPGHGWMELRADLSAYAGFKWSLFYRPDRMTWHVVLGTDPGSAAGATTAAWGTPEILADSESAKEYALRAGRQRGGS